MKINFRNGVEVVLMEIDNELFQNYKYDLVYFIVFLCCVLIGEFEMENTNMLL